MTNKITLGLVGLVLVLTVWNTVQISNIEVHNVLPGSGGNTAQMPAPAQPSNPQIPNQNQVKPTTPNQPNNPLAQNTPPTGPTTAIKFQSEVHDFGNVDAETENKYSFEFKNTGTEPLTISNARGSCGCTVPNWPKEPIMPGKTGMIDVIFRPTKAQAGKAQEKTVTVTANTNPTNTIVKIKAFVNAEE